MKRYLLILVALLFSVSLAEAQNTTKLCFSTNGSNCVPVDASNPLPTTSSGGGAADVNLTEILGAAPSLTNPLFVAPSAGSFFAVTGPLTDVQLRATAVPVSGSLGQIGASNLATAQVSIATSSTLAVAARANRRAVTITNITGTQQIFCSETTATLINGQLIPAVVGANFTFPYSGIINCIASTGAQTVSITETY